MECTPAIHKTHAAAAQEFLDSLASPSCQRFLGSEPVVDCGSTSPTLLEPPLTAAGGTVAARAIEDARLQATLQSLRHKESELMGGRQGDTSLGAVSGGGMIAAWAPTQLSSAATAAAAGQQAAAEAAALRLQVVELRSALATAESRCCRSSDAQAALEERLAAAEQAAAARETEAAQASAALRLLEQEAAAATASAAAARKTAMARGEEWEKERRFLREQLAGREAELCQLGAAVQGQAAEAERRARDAAAREAELAAAQARAAEGAAGAAAEAALAREQAEGEARRAKAAEGAAAELRRQKAAMLADMRVLEELLAEADAERK